MFWGNGGTPYLSVHLIEDQGQFRQDSVNDGLNLPDGVVLRDQLL